jgi:hypothetical protein
MSKRDCAFTARRPRDFYPTPVEALVPLLVALRRAPPLRHVEPCAGNGALVRALEAAGNTCAHARFCPPWARYRNRRRRCADQRRDGLLRRGFHCDNPPFAPVLLTPLMTCRIALGVPLWLLPARYLPGEGSSASSVTQVRDWMAGKKRGLLRCCVRRSRKPCRPCRRPPR